MYVLLTARSIFPSPAGRPSRPHRCGCKCLCCVPGPAEGTLGGHGTGSGMGTLSGHPAPRSQEDFGAGYCPCGRRRRCPQRGCAGALEKTLKVPGILWGLQSNRARCDPGERAGVPRVPWGCPAARRLPGTNRGRSGRSSSRHGPDELITS